MSRIIVALFVLVFLASCAGDSCARAICGCWRSQTFREVISVVDAESYPVSGIMLYCETSKAPIGVTDEFGTVHTRIKGRSSPGCGIAADCAESTLRDGSGNVLAKVNLTQLIRGQAVSAGEYRLKVIRDVD